MISNSDGAARIADTTVRRPQPLERLRTGHFVHQVPVDVEQDRPVVELGHDMLVPYLVEQQFRIRAGHATRASRQARASTALRPLPPTCPPGHPPTSQNGQAPWRE